MAHRSATKDRQEHRPERSALDQVIGWQGTTVVAPSDWNLVGFGGEEKNGSLRLDSGDQDGKLRSLELRWAHTKGAQSVKDLEARIAPLLKKAERSAKKAGHSGDTETHAIEDRRHEDRKAVLSFSWRAGELAAQGRIWHCETCRRVVVAQVYTEADSRSSSPRIKSLANEVLAGIDCHSPEDGWRTWGLYGLNTSVPSDFTLTGQQLMNVYLQLSFTRGQSTDALTVEQWNLANVQLKGMYLDEWFEHKCAALAGSARLDKSEAKAKGHPALLVTGKRSGVSYWATEVPRNAAKLKMPALHYAAVLWECPQSNRAYLIQSFSRRPRPELVEEIAGRTVCHT